MGKLIVNEKVKMLIDRNPKLLVYVNSGQYTDEQLEMLAAGLDSGMNMKILANPSNTSDDMYSLICQFRSLTDQDKYILSLMTSSQKERYRETHEGIQQFCKERLYK